MKTSLFIVLPSDFRILMPMNPPLLEIVLRLRYDPVEYTEERLQYFYRMNNDILAQSKSMEKPTAACYSSIDKLDSILITSDQIELRSKRGTSYPRLQANWTRLLANLVDIFAVDSFSDVSLSYWNEIPLEDLHSFRNYLNISIEMPSSLKERFEFFRSEFIYKYDFGEIHVWLQPDWDEQMDSYCIQLNLEATHLGKVETRDLFSELIQLHEGIKDVFHQMLSQDYIQKLPQ